MKTAEQAFSLDKFERLVHQRQHEEAYRMLLELLEAFEKGAGLNVPANSGMTRGTEAVMNAYTRIASSVTALLSDGAMQLSESGYEALSLHHKSIHGIFRLSGFGNADHLCNLLCSYNSGALLRLDPKDRQNFLKFMLCYSLPSQIKPDLEKCLEVAPIDFLPIYLGMLSGEAVLDPLSHELRSRLLTMGECLGNLSVPDILLCRLANAWMLCSYADDAAKHEVKAHLNKMLRKWIADKGIEAPDMPRCRKKTAKPKILVIAEYFNSNHAVFRCFGHALSRLEGQFRLILLAEKGKTDDRSKELFHEVITIDTNTPDISQLLDAVARTAPDMICYPSVGMLVWSIILVNLRLAPVQFALMGHPATTMSPYMDYLILGSNHLGDPRLYSEKLIVLSSPFPIMLRSEAVPVKPEIRRRPDHLSIAVTGTSYKLNPSFMELCRNLENKSGRILDFHFFPLNATGFRYHLICREIWAWLPSARVHPFADYAAYIADLNACDVFLGTFPFGGTNSTIDCMMVGIPGVVYEGAEARSRLDSRIARLFGLPEWTVASSVEEYENAALTLISDDANRISLAELLLATEAREVIQREQPGFAEEFTGAIGFIYENHELIQQDGAKVWMPETRRGFPADR